jgi:tetratricopeptide (TPR) repeat protein
MKMKLMTFILGLLATAFITSGTQAQRVELILKDDALLVGGRNALHAGNYDRAAFYYEEAIKRKSLSKLEMIEVHNGLCVTYMYLEKFEDAIVQCEESIDLQNNRWQTYNNLGTVYLVMGDYDNAIATYEKALKMKPKSQILQFNLGIAKERRNARRINGSNSQNPDGRSAAFSSAGDK